MPQNVAGFSEYSMQGYETLGFLFFFPFFWRFKYPIALSSRLHGFSEGQCDSHLCPSIGNCFFPSISFRGFFRNTLSLQFEVMYIGGVLVPCPAWCSLTSRVCGLVPDTNLEKLSVIGVRGVPVPFFLLLLLVLLLRICYTFYSCSTVLWRSVILGLVFLGGLVVYVSVLEIFPDIIRKLRSAFLSHV